jgi:hypothetical protein
VNDREWATVEAVRLNTFTTMVNEGVMLPAGPRQPPFLGQFDVNCCVAATALALEVLKEFFIFGRAMKVQVAVMNNVAVQWGKDMETAEAVETAVAQPSTPPDGTMIRYCGFSGKNNPGWLDGHLVAIIENEVLFDPSAPQFSIPQARMLIEPLCIDLRDGYGKEWLTQPTEWLAVEIEDSDGGVINYRHHHDLSDVFDAPDWQTRTRWDMQHFKAEIVAKVRRHLMSIPTS